MFDFYKFADTGPLRSGQSHVNIPSGHDYGVALRVGLGLAFARAAGDAAAAGLLAVVGDAPVDADGDALLEAVGIAAPSTCTRSRTA